MKKTFKVLTLLLGFSFLVSCGKSGHKYVTDVQFETVTHDENSFLDTSFTLDLGNVEIPYYFSEIGKGYGSFSLATIDGKPVLNLHLNLSELLKLPQSANPTLPNGTNLPIDAGSLGIIELPIDDVLGKIYVAASSDNLFVGFAFSIKELNVVGQKLGKVNLFYNFNVKGVLGSAGLFSDSALNQTGIAAFVNLKGLIGTRTEYVSKRKAKILDKELKKIFNSQEKIELHLVK